MEKYIEKRRAFAAFRPSLFLTFVLVSTLPLILVVNGCAPGPEGKEEPAEAAPPAVLEAVPAGDYYFLEACKPDEKYGSYMFRQLSEFSEKAKSRQAYAAKTTTSLGAELADHEMELRLISSYESENLTYHQGVFSREELTDYFKSTLSTGEIGSEDITGYQYYSDSEGRGLLLLGSGIVFANRDIVLASYGEEQQDRARLYQEDAFYNSLNLVDFNATEYRLQWDRLGDVQNSWTNALKPIANEEVLRAVQETVAYGFSGYWSYHYESTLKIRFESPEAAKILAEFMKENIGLIAQYRHPFTVFWLHETIRLTPDQMKELGNLFEVSHIGQDLEIRLNISWEEANKFIQFGVEEDTSAVAEDEKDKEKIQYGENIIIVLPTGRIEGEPATDFEVMVLDSWGNKRIFASKDIRQLANYLEGVFSALRNRWPDSWHNAPLTLLVAKDAPWVGFVDVWEEIRKLERGLQSYFPKDVPAHDRKLRTNVPPIEVAEEAIEKLRDQGRLNKE